ncbi:MAG TPA: NAD(P)-dependent oxidoreductase [Candidatus Micrarchaeia archaeon]|nr:NAD(P)-dependent oxidoreductase [Candidatus Micrarchaeia archaeon]
MATVGFVGLGTMGGRVAKRLLDAGHVVHGFNRRPQRAAWLVPEGLVLCSSPRAVAETTEVVISMVANTEALEAVAKGDDGILAGLRPGQVYVDSSTVAPQTIRALATVASERQAHLLDAPVSGSVATLEAGRLSIMVSGDETAFERVHPLLLDIGSTVTYVGSSGKAMLMKLATNLNLAVQMAAFSEAVLLAERSGIPRATAAEVLLQSVIASPMLQYRGPFVLEMPEAAWFDVDMMQKDLQLALEAGRSVGVATPTAAAANELLTAARGLGWAGEDFAVVFRVLARLSGVEA